MLEMLNYHKARVNSLIDGDTYDITVDVGFGMSWRGRMRLLGCDTPEVKGPTAQRGRQVTQEVKQLLAAVEYEVIIKVEKYDNFGRCLAYLFFNKSGNGWVSLTEYLIKNGMAVEFMTMDLSTIPPLQGIVPETGE